ncbi:MAG: hypothetical protein ACRCXC_03890 [Legionella sp.]
MIRKYLSPHLSMNKVKIAHFTNSYFILILTGIVIFGSPVLLFIDSPWFASYYPSGQNIANTLVLITYSLFLFVAKRKIYWLILLMTIVSLCAEVLGSLILVLYQYRLKNITMYIPLGHAMIYASVYYLSTEPLVWKYHKEIENLLGKFAFVAAFMSLMVLHDVACFLCYILFLFILSYRNKPLFYLSMFVMVYYVEFLGTDFSAWQWYGVLGNHPHLPTIGYTPSSAAGLYVLIDLISNSIYFYAKKLKRSLHKILPEYRNLKTSTF